MSDDCEARRVQSGEMACTRCGLRWDANDPDPPVCPKLVQAIIPAAKLKASLQARLTVLLERMRLGGVLADYLDDLEDLIVEVGVMEERSWPPPPPPPGSFSGNVTPFIRRR